MKIASRFYRSAAIGSAVALGVGLSGCIDDKYDLSDIDTTARVNFNDLVLPVKMAPVELQNVIEADASDDLESDAEFRYNVETGEYYIQTDGTFSVDDITINGINVDPLDNETRTVTTPVRQGSEKLSEISGVDLNDLLYDFTYEFDGVDDYIQDISVATTDFSININARTSSPDVMLSDMCFHFPAGLVGTPVADNGRYDVDYDINTGLLTVYGQYTQMHLVFDVDQLYLHEAGGQFNRADATFIFKNNVGVVDAEIVSENAAPSVTISIDYDFSALDVTAITGIIHYDADVDDSSVSLADLPKELRQEGTDITLLDPQIYLNVTNPLAEYGAFAETGLAIYQVRDDDTAADPSAEISDVKIGFNPNTGAPVLDQTILLSTGTEAPENTIMPFTNHVRFDGLGAVVAGNGLPTELLVRFVDPRVPMNTKVTDFPIGQTVSRVEGTYTFYAPLALAKDSRIVYSDDDCGWDLEDADDLHIDLLEITTDVTSELPLSVTLSAIPLDKKGDPMDPEKIKVTPAEIPANSTASVVLRVTGDIVGIDGIRYTATVVADGSEKALTRTMKLKLDNLRGKINGYYQTKM